jgi:hypothetical protein
MFLVWSYEHRAWWGPNERGYTNAIVAAGRYTAEQALDIVYGANAITGRLEEIAVAESVAAVFMLRAAK